MRPSSCHMSPLLNSLALLLAMPNLVVGLSESQGLVTIFGILDWDFGAVMQGYPDDQKLSFVDIKIKVLPQDILEHNLMLTKSSF